ncbi:hypothetical protein [Brevibacillus brevis]|uniref:Uncharacterized protein n=1 Tax=Brevibacillus brevis TaxID=1393 RepID=A0ABY9T5C3_BREBE|nr:hypothetical protein [Brevibacillus brevis]WNC15301.1 hypothetical protein RGB73_02685 [Brevibacillus brevis]
MMQKWCKRCKNHSFSSGDWYKWICPYCGRDLTAQKADPVGIRLIMKRPLAPQRFQPSGLKRNRPDENTA